MKRKGPTASGVYRIVHVASGREYIGQSQNIAVRWNHHRSSLRKGTHHAAYLQRVWAKYGEDGFLFEVLVFCSIDELDDTEQRFLDERVAVFNPCRIAGSTRGFKQAEEQIAKRRGIPRSPETIEKMRQAMLGKKHSEETKAKMRGKPVPQERRDRISAGLKGSKASPQKIEKMKLRRHTEQSKERLRIAHTGKKLSADHCAKISERQRGKRPSKETKAKLSAALKGRPKSEHHCMALRAAWARRKAAV